MDVVNSPIEQRNTGKGNPNAILHFNRSLNNRQRRLMDRLSGFDSWATLPKKAVNLRDLSALTAETGDEYAQFTRQSERMVLRGNSRMTNIDVAAAKKMAAEGWRWSGHTHPGVDEFCLIPSDGDKAVLKAFDQTQSCILNSSGMWNTFREDE